MDFRLRKLLSPRKHKAQRSDASAELNFPSESGTTAPAPGRLPGLIHQAFGKTDGLKQRESRQLSNANPLRSFSYEETAPGKPPQLGDLPRRGNGPVRLQTSRRLSSGELRVTEQDYGRTLEEIRGGEYIVGGKERRTSKTSAHSRSSAAPAQTPGTKFLSTAPSSPRDQVTFPGSIWRPGLTRADGGLVASPASSESPYLDPRRSSSAQAYHPAQPIYLRHVASTVSLVESRDRQNPAIQALWRAEQSRLVSINSQQNIHYPSDERNGELGRTTRQGESKSSRHRSYSSSSQPRISMGHRVPASSTLGSETAAQASASTLELHNHDDHSDNSSHMRFSHLSSNGTASSFTTGTSVAEDMFTSRDDIRRIVDDMRTNYLQAIEAQTPPLRPLPSPPMQGRPRSKKQNTPLTSRASVDGSLRPVSQSSAARTKSWQSASTPRTSISSSITKATRSGSAASRRASGQPVAGIATLTPIEASPVRSVKPSRPKKNDEGLKRADSTTLGVMARKLTIVNDSRSAASQQHYKSSPTFYSSSTSSSDSENGGTSTSPPSLRISASTMKSSTSSVQNTPEKHKPAQTQPQSSLTKVPWQLEVDRILADDEVKLALDIDDFETLCDGLFNSSVLTEKMEQQSGLLSSWSTTTSPTSGHDVFSSPRQRPAELRNSKFPDHQLGLGVTGMPSMI
jgi:hypothetical protein